MDHKTKSATQPLNNKFGGVGGWIASLVVWCAVIAVSLASVCFLLGPLSRGRRGHYHARLTQFQVIVYAAFFTFAHRAR
jgi:hypothetical protein